MLKHPTISSLSFPPPLPSPPPSPSFLHFNETTPITTTATTTTTTTWRKRWAPQTQLRVSSPDSYQTAVVASPAAAADIVRRFYKGINGHDLVSVEELIADKCVYEDLIFPRPFVGRKAILEFFKKFNDSISTDLQFVIDDISTEDSSAVGVTWHLEWKGKPFPFSKGCSFYRLEVVNGKRQIIYGRDSVEPAFKPGETALTAIRAVTWLLQQFPQLADQL